MGQTLSEPKRDKHSTSGDGKRFCYGATAMQGWRISMEDAHTTLLRLNDQIDAGFFGVFDGHGGQAAARFCGEQLHHILAKQPALAAHKYEEAIKATYLQADEELKTYPPFIQEESGCTAGNAGDSRCVLSANGNAQDLSIDHKPSLKSEEERILAARGYIEFGRVNGNLALSRAIGDFESRCEVEAQWLTNIGNPEIMSKKLVPTDEFVVLACDGIWDVANSRKVVNFVRERIVAKIPLDKICEQLCDLCIAPSTEMDGLGCDNMTVVIVALLQGKTKEEWYEEVGRRTMEQGVQYWGGNAQHILSGYPIPDDDDSSRSPTTDEASFLTPEYLKAYLMRGAHVEESASDHAHSSHAADAIALSEETSADTTESKDEPML